MKFNTIHKKYYRNDNFLLSIIITLFAGVLFFISPILSIVIISVFPIFFVLKTRPEIGVLAIVFLISSIFYSNELPVIRIGFGSIHIADAFLLTLLFMIPLNLIVDRSSTLIKTPLDKPLLLFYLAVLLSAFISLYYYNIELHVVTGKLREFSYSLLFFVVTNLIRKKKQIRFLIIGLFAIAFFVTIVMVIQAMLGDSVILLAGRVEKAAVMEIEQTYEAIRMLPPGRTLIFILFLIAVCVTVFIRYKPLLKSWSFYLCIILGIGNLLTYIRSYWISIILSLSVFILILSKKGRRRLVAMFISIFMFTLSFIIVFSNTVENSNNTMNAISERFTSLFVGNVWTQSESLEWRYTENKYAIRTIIEHPLFGIGIGNHYRPPIFGIEDTLTWYIHNAYLFILLKLGLIGFIPFLWFYIGFLKRGFSNWKRVGDNLSKAAIIGSTLGVFGFVWSAFIMPVFMEWESIVVFSTVIGLSESIAKIDNGKVPI